MIVHSHRSVDLSLTSKDTSSVQLPKATLNCVLVCWLHWLGLSLKFTLCRRARHASSEFDWRRKRTTTNHMRGLSCTELMKYICFRISSIAVWSHMFCALDTKLIVDGVMLHIPPLKQLVNKYRTFVFFFVKQISWLAFLNVTAPNTCLVFKIKPTQSN